MIEYIYIAHIFYLPFVFIYLDNSRFLPFLFYVKLPHTCYVHFSCKASGLHVFRSSGAKPRAAALHIVEHIDSALMSAALELRVDPRLGDPQRLIDSCRPAAKREYVRIIVPS